MSLKFQCNDRVRSKQMREDAARRVGMDPKDLKEDLFPKETFGRRKEES
ncbi:MAG: hypothetical protein Ct9H300mP20_15530 [Gammaproteobacteria bacterium]|nr:MAG: hypothetical protein Ct9H300mP20_15530 [Gammaproteobacteria bacterium]